jgi:hypothetical protein
MAMGSRRYHVSSAASASRSRRVTVSPRRSVMAVMSSMASGKISRLRKCEASWSAASNTSSPTT